MILTVTDEHLLYMVGIHIFFQAVKMNIVD